MLGIGPRGPTGREAPDARPPGSLDAADDARAATPTDLAQSERDARVVLTSVRGLGPAGLGRLLRRFGDGRTVLAAADSPAGRRRIAASLRRGGSDESIDGPEEPAALGPDAIGIAAGIAAAEARHEEILDRVRSLGLAVVTVDEVGFPRRLRELELPPHLLFVRGDPAALGARRTVAVVGTRRPTEYGRRVAGRIASAIGAAGGTVVSGLAIGIDGAAHGAAVAARVPTVAVIGGGHGHLFPRAHERLAEEIVATGGAVVAELFPDEAPTRGTFPRRNRLISGLSEATIVIEAPARSGALITARWALEQGRDCYLVPGPIDAPASAGCLTFLHEHAGLARLVATVPDLIDDLGFVEAGPGSSSAGRLVELGSVERRLVVAISGGATTTDELATALREPIATILSGLTLLEMRGLVNETYGRYRLDGRLAGASLA